MSILNDIDDIPILIHYYWFLLFFVTKLNKMHI